MAVDAPLITRQRVMAASVEATTGTAETLDATDAAFNVFEHNPGFDIEMNERQGQSSVSPLKAVAGKQSFTYGFETELVGQGSSGDPGWASTLLKAAGFNNSGSVYTPRTGLASPVTLTLGHYVDGNLYRGAGCVLDLTMAFTTGNPVRMQWSAQGKYVAPSADAILAPTYPTTMPPAFRGGTLTIGGTSYKVSELQIAMNNQIVMREDPEDGTGIHAYVIVDRGIRITMDPENVGQGTKDWQAELIASTTAALSIVVGSAGNNIMTIGAPVLQPMTANPGDRGGIWVDQIEFQCARSAAAGDDELSLTFS